MEITITLDEPEIISYVKNIKENRDSFLKDALLIGMKCLNNAKIDVSSYDEPLLKPIIQRWEPLEEKLDYMLSIKKNSSKKGQFGENLSANMISQCKPDMFVEVVSGEGKQGDIHVDTGPNHGNHKIMIENKVYDANVNLTEVEKFKRDMKTANFKFGIFHSATSGIVGKKNHIEWELFENKILVYISNIGINGIGCVYAIDVLLILINSDILNNTHNFFHENYQLSEFIDKMNPYIIKLKEKHTRHIKQYESMKEFENKLLKVFEKMKSEAYDLAIDYERDVKDMLNDISGFIPKKRLILDFDEQVYLESINDKKLRNIYNHLLFLISSTNYIITQIEDDLLLNNGQFIIKRYKNKCELKSLLPSDSYNVNYDRRYAKERDNYIIIEIREYNIDLFEYLKKNLNV
jgi:hypothetical protein